MKNYINGETRAKVAYLRDINLLYKSLINSNSFTKEEKTELKHACTRHDKAIKLMQNRLPDDFKKIDRMLSDNIIVMKPKVQELMDHRAIYLRDDRLRGILEVMINDHCVGCKETNFKQCHIFRLNDDLEVSSEYQEPNGVCCFAYMGEREKRKNPDYGSIFIKE